MPETICKFEIQSDGLCKCSVCGYKTKHCKAFRQCGPSIAQKVVNFLAASTKHAIAGNPVVREEVMKQRLEICRACPLFKANGNEVGGVCTHSSCGCNIQDNLNYLNKIAWADQECPIGSWPKMV